MSARKGGWRRVLDLALRRDPLYRQTTLRRKFGLESVVEQLRVDGEATIPSDIEVTPTLVANMCWELGEAVDVRWEDGNAIARVLK